MKSEKTLLVLDLDGTLTKSDNLIRFSLFMISKKKRFRFLIFLPLLLLLRCKFINNIKFKILYCSLILKNQDIKYIENCVGDFITLESFKDDISEEVMDFITKYDNAEKLILTANYSFLAKPISNLLNINKQISIQLETKENRFTGKTIGHLPYGSAKVDVLKRFLTHLNYKHIIGLADSKEDIPLLKFLNEGYMVTFNKDLRKTDFLKV